MIGLHYSSYSVEVHDTLTKWLGEVGHKIYRVLTIQFIFVQIDNTSSEETLLQNKYKSLREAAERLALRTGQAKGTRGIGFNRIQFTGINEVLRKGLFFWIK